MAELVTLTDDQQQTVLRLASSSARTNAEAEALVQSIRVVRSQGDAIERVRKLLAEGHPVGSPEARLASDVREALGG